MLEICYIKIECTKVHCGIYSKMMLRIDFARLKLVLSRLRMQVKQNLERSRNSRYLGSKTWQGLNSSFENERGGAGGREG